MTQGVKNAIAGIVFSMLTLSACVKEKSDIITIDGSSTVFPITEAIAEEFQGQYNARVTIGVSGSGGGFKKFCKNEIIISNASRPIKPSEKELCAENDIDYIELAIAYDGIAIVVHPDADWISQITVQELKKIWEPEAQNKVSHWNQVREGWPVQEIHLFGPGIDSGTYDYFTQVIVGIEHSSRGDFTSSENDNILVQGIANDNQALGFFGLAYYTENKDKIKVIPVDDEDDSNGTGAITPSLKTVSDDTYRPLSRPLFLYVNKDASERKEVQDFISFYLSEGDSLVEEVGYIPLPGPVATAMKQRFDERIIGSFFEDQESGTERSIEKVQSQ